ncbi:chaperonin GroEL [Eggerthellaceae bacterium 3-80]|nr:chaperonin GroEL [bacterium D16-34]
MSKNIAFDNETRKKLAAGAAKLADAVKVTLGPKGRYVAMQKIGAWTPTLTNDGAMVAANVDLEDQIENMGMKIVREAAMGTNLGAGDGTTTATLLAEAMISEGVREVIAGADPIAVRRGIKKATNAVMELVASRAVEVTSEEQIAEIATISSGDPEIGAKLGELLAKIGKDGVISVEKSNNFGINVKVQKGMRFDHGFINPEFADDMGTMTAELVEPYILITDYRLADNFKDIVPVLEEVMQTGHPLLICCEDVRGESLHSLLMNKQKGTLNSVCVQAPAFGDRRLVLSEDLALLTGGQFVSETRGLKLTDLTKDMLGRADSAMITKGSTVVIGGKGKKEDIDVVCSQLRSEIEVTAPGMDHDVLRERLSMLQGGIGVMEVGAPTKSEMNEMRSRIQDALMATRSAASEGLVAGGGTALLQAESSLDSVVCDNEDERAGVEIVRKALQTPIRTLAENCGFEPSVVVEKVRNLPLGHGLNCANGEYGDMIAMGVADPTKVTRTALDAAASVACQVLITNASVVDTIPPEPPAPKAPVYGQEED